MVEAFTGQIGVTILGMVVVLSVMAVLNWLEENDHE